MNVTAAVTERITKAAAVVLVMAIVDFPFELYVSRACVLYSHGTFDVPL